MCWNMETFSGQSTATANLNVDTFAPTDLDIANWLDAIQAAGCKYATLTTKHHSGFALWPTAYHVGENPPYSIAQTAWYAANGSPDVVGLFVAGCRARNINPCIYFSIWDSTWEARTGTDQTTGTAAYIAMIQAQLTELLTNYGDITAIWLDGWGWKLGYDYIPYATIYNIIKGLQPGCLVIDNANTVHPCPTSQIDIYENGGMPDSNTLYAEEVVRIKTSGGSWFYETAPATLRTAESIRSEIDRCNLHGGAYHLGTYPDRTGHLTDDQIAVLLQL